MKFIKLADSRIGILLLRCLSAFILLAQALLSVRPASADWLTIDGKNPSKIESPPAVVDRLPPLDSGDQVSPTGAFTTSIPIELPPGRQGLTPPISLDYNSRRGNGLVGVGWVLRGFPAIGRMNFGGGVNYDSNDNFVFLPDGFDSPEFPDNRLVKKPNTMNRYHLAKNEAGSPLWEFEAIFDKGCGSGPCYWIVRDGQGNTYYFGGEAGFHAGMESSPPTSFLWEPSNGLTARRGIATWALHKVEDIHHNYYTVFYRGHFLPGSGTRLLQVLWPGEVFYMMNNSNLNLRTIRIEFEYESRPDITPMPGHFDMRLSGIRIHGHCRILRCTLIRRYTLGYMMSEESGLSLFSFFQEWGYDPITRVEVSKPMMKFTYSPGGNRTEMLSSGDTVQHPMRTLQEYPHDFTSLGPRQGLSIWETHVGDTNGDGRPEVVRVFQGETDLHGSQDNMYTTLVEVAPSAHHLTGETLGEFDAPIMVYRRRSDEERISAGHSDEWHSLLGDITGDGRADLILYHYASHGLYIQYMLGGSEPGGLGQPIIWPHFLTWSETSDETRETAEVTLGDVNGDQKLDLVLLNYRINMLLFAMGTSSGLDSAVQRFFSPLPTLCADDDSSPNCLYATKDLLVSDFNGDGTDDVLGVWRTKGHPDSTNNSGIVQWVFAPGSTSEPLLNPTVVRQIVHSKRPLRGVVAGDINGDGLVDAMLARSGYEGTIPEVDSCVEDQCDLEGQYIAYGREIRVLLGGSNVLANRFRELLLEDDGSIYPFDEYFPAANWPPYHHMANWNHMLVDLNGDGIDDGLHVYRGHFGTRVDYLYHGIDGAYPTPVSEDPHHHVVDDPEEWLDGHWECCTFRSGTTDLNGDGNADLVLSYNGGWGIRVEYALGTSNRSSASTPFKTLLSPDGSNLPLAAECPAETCVHDVGNVHFADINGDGRQDIILVGNHDATPTFLGLGRMRYLLSIPGRPDLLTRIENGYGATTTIEYRTSVRSDRPFSHPINQTNTCAGANGEDTLSGAICGIADLFPHDLVTRIVLNNGRGFATRIRVEYDNGRVMRGSIVNRDQLGFERITKVNEDSGLAHVTIYRQDQPFQRLPYSQEIWADNCSASSFEPCRVLMQRMLFNYTSLPNELGIKIIGLQTHATEEYEAQWASLTTRLVHTRRLLYSYDPDFFIVAREESCTSDPNENCIITENAYTHNTMDWLIGRLDATWTLRKNSSGQTVMLDMYRIAYDLIHPLNIVGRDRLFFLRDAEQATCRYIGDRNTWQETCGDEVAANTARWVPVEQNIRYIDDNGVYQYGNVTHIEDALGHAIDFAYDPNYLAYPARITNALGHVEQHMYDAAGRLITVHDPNNQTTTIHYEPLGRPSEFITPALSTSEFKKWLYLDWGDLNGSLNSQRVRETTFADVNKQHDIDRYFDGFGTVYKIIDYSDIGTITTTIKWSWELEPIERNRYELVVRESYPRFEGDPLRAIETRFDPVGRPYVINRVMNPTGIGNQWRVEKQIWHYDYTATANPRGGFWKSVLGKDAEGRSEIQHINARGLLAAVDDGKGQRTYYDYDVANNLGKVTLPGSLTANARYDNWGRLREFTDYATGTTVFDFDDLGNLKMRGTSNGQTVSYHYDALNRIESEIGQSLAVSYHYDEPNHDFSIGRLTSVQDNSGSTEFYYDERGNISRQKINLSGLDATIAYEYQYDQTNRITEKSFLVGLPAEITQVFNYTSDGLLKRVRQGNICFADYTRFNAVKQLEIQESYGLWDPATDSCAEPTTITNLGYTEDQQLEWISVKNPAQDFVQSLRYEYYPAGNLKTIHDWRTNIIVNGTFTSDYQTFTYDELNRLSTALGHSYGSRTYDYDGVGNITQNGNLVISYTRCPGHVNQQCITGRQGDQGPFLWYAVHDAAGNRLTFEDLDSSDGNGISLWGYSYDALNRLTHVHKDGELRVQLVYDFSGAKVKKILTLPDSSTITTYYLGSDLELRNTSHDPDVFALTYRVSNIATVSPGTLTRSAQNVWSFTADQAIDGQATESSALANLGSSLSGNTLHGQVLGTWIHHPNHLGTISVKSQASTGTVVNRILHEPFGGMISRDPSCSSTSTECPSSVGLLRCYDTGQGNFVCPGSIGLDGHTHKFNGNELDEEINLYDYGARFYDPVTARFITADDWIPNGGVNPQAFNRFAYVLNNPVRFVDPTGHQPADDDSLPEPDWFNDPDITPDTPPIPEDQPSPAQNPPRKYGADEFDPLIVVGDVPPEPKTAKDPPSVLDRLGPRPLPNFITPGQALGIVRTARDKWMGTPYVKKGKTTCGADCSGAVWGIYQNAGFPYKYANSYALPMSPNFRPAPGNIPQVGDIGQMGFGNRDNWKGHLLIYDPDAGKGYDSWSAHHPGGAPFGPASVKWFTDKWGPVVWYRYVLP